MGKKFREPLAALFLSLALPGLGQIYAGRPVKGICFFLFAVALDLWLMINFFSPSVKITVFWFACLVFAFVFFLWNIIDAYLTARKHNSADGTAKKPGLLEKNLLISGAILIVLVYFLAVQNIQRNFYGSFTSPPDSMEPTIYKDERVLVDLRFYKIFSPQRGDIILYRYPKEPAKIYMHRIVGLPGEAVLLKDQKIFINKVQLKDNWALKIRHYNGGKFAERGLPAVTVPPDSYYVLGDNAARSQDSRYWGCLPANHLIGKVYKVYFPFNRSGPVN